VPSERGMPAALGVPQRGHGTVILLAPNFGAPGQRITIWLGYGEGPRVEMAAVTVFAVVRGSACPSRGWWRCRRSFRSCVVGAI
jgi:hypothetical protein